MSYNPTREWTIAAAELTFANNNFHWLYVKVPIDTLITTATVVASESHIDALPEDGYIYYKIGFAAPVAGGERELHTLWGASRPGSGGGISEAPADGEIYGRKDSAWIEIAPKPKQVTGLTLLSTGWTLVSGLYEYDLTNANITATASVEVIPDNADVETVKTAEVLPATDSSAGSVKIYAVNEPTADIGVTINIFEVTTP